jgi:hypothetical protein
LRPRGCLPSDVVAPDGQYGILSGFVVPGHGLQVQPGRVSDLAARRPPALSGIRKCVLGSAHACLLVRLLPYDGTHRDRRTLVEAINLPP